MAVTYNHLQRNLILHPPPVPPHAASKRISPSSPNPFLASSRVSPPSSPRYPIPYLKSPGKFKNGIFKIFGNNTISEFTKIASSFLQLGSKEEHDLDGVLGVTEDVVAFARSVALHPEVWLDFPLLNDEDSDATHHVYRNLQGLSYDSSNQPYRTACNNGGKLLSINGVTATQADVEISFEMSNLREAEVLEYWKDPQILCSKEGSSLKSGLGPFGLLVFASEGLQEYTSVFFRIFRHQHKYLVLLCSDQNQHCSQSRYLLPPVMEAQAQVASPLHPCLVFPFHVYANTSQ
ncbi:hypothetical protein JHK82_022360 [Glycine max]|nr:hypothetical protein JHK82_022360 [Glycine max]